MKTWFRALYVALLLALLWWAGVPLDAIIVLAVLSAALLLARERIWKKADRLVNSLGFTRRWPEWAKRALVLAVFIAALYFLKTVAYFALGLAGMDIQGELSRAFNATA